MVGDDKPNGLPRRAGQGGDPAGLPEAFRPLAPVTPGEHPSPRQAQRAPSGARGPRPRPRGTVPQSRLAASSLARTAPARTAAALTPPAPDPQPATDAVSVVAPGAVRPRRTVLVSVSVVVCALMVLGGVTALLRDPGEAPRGDEGSAARADREVSSTGDFDPPETMGPDTELVATEVLEGGDLLVTHWIHTSVPMEQLELKVPTSQRLADPTVAVTRLVVVADGVQVDLAGTVVSGAEGAGALPAASNLYVQYRLSGVMERSSSAEGRALATVTSLHMVVGSSALARTQTFPGTTVLTLACLAPGARSIPQPCGRFEEGVWAVASDAGDVPDTVIAQFDLTVER